MTMPAAARAFYQRAVCGGLLMKLTDGQQAATATVPMAFQSALAGIMLAAELIKDAAGCAPAPTPITRINLLRPLAPFLHDPRAKDASGRCMCADADVLAVYKRKYATAPGPRRGRSNSPLSQVASSSTG
jgi:hypothetical protein